MAQTPATAADFSRFQVVFHVAVKSYQKQTKNDLIAHPLTSQLRSCDSTSAILAILQDQVQEFDKSFSGDERLTKWLSSTVNVLSAFSAAVSEGVSLVFLPANVIFAGIGVFVQAANDVAASKDVLVELFERIGYFFTRLETYTEVAPTTAMTDVITQIMVEVLRVFGIATKELRRGLANKFLRKLAGTADLEDALKKLDRLTQEQARMAHAETLRITHSVDARVKDVKVMVKRVVSDSEEAERTRLARDVYQWCSPPDPSTNYNFGCQVHQEGSSAWFLQGAKFGEWMSMGSLLWIHGKPGSGKSVLCSAIIKEIMSLRDSGQASLAFFYFDFRDERKKNFRDFVTCLLVQLSTHSSPCREAIVRIYSTHGDGAYKPSNDALTNCLREMLSVAAQQPIYIIVDALDDCPNDSSIPTPREYVLSLLQDLVDLRLANLRICVTSRPDVDIRAILEPLASGIVSLHDERGQIEDISNYVSMVVKSERKMRRWPSNEKKLVIDTLSNRADGMFRWVFCQLEVLRRCPQASIRQTLDQFPEALAETYERALHQISPEIWAYAHQLLQYLVVAVRPLYVEELADLLAFEFDAAQGEIPKYRTDWRCDDETGEVLSTCPSLVTVIDEPRDDRQIVQFSHFSVKEFLTSNILASSHGDLSRFHIHLLPAHTVLTRACLGILLHLDDHNDKNNAKGFPLVEYAAQYWVKHAKFDGVASCVKDGMETLFDPDKPYFVAWIGIYDIDRPEVYERDFSGSEIPPNPTPNPLYYAVLCGFYDLVKHLAIKHPQYVNAIGGRYDFPLLAALGEDYLDVAELLLEHGANVDVRNATGKTILLKALSPPQRNIVNTVLVLLKHGADVNTQDDTVGGPLHYLAEYGGELEVAQILLDHGANVNSQDINGKTPMHILSESRMRDEDDVLTYGRLFLERGADVNTRDKDNKTPLLLAMQKNWFKLAQILLGNENAEDASDKVKVTDVDQKVEGIDEWAQPEDVNDHRAQDADNWIPRAQDADDPLSISLPPPHELVEPLRVPQYDDDKLRRRSVDNQEQRPRGPSHLSPPTPPPTASRGRLYSLGERELSPMRVAATKATQPITSIKRAAPQSTTGASARLPTVSLGGAAAPATSALAQFSSATHTQSLPPTLPEQVGDQRADGDGAIAPSSTWWNNMKRKRTNPIEQAEGYARTRSRAIEAIGGALGMAANIGHEVLFIGVDLLKFAPVPGLDTAGKILLSIWDAVDMVETNRRASLRLIERCAEILISIREELIDAGYSVVEELGAPMEKLVKAFEEVRSCLQKLGHCPFLERYLKRDEILSSISACNTALNDSLDKFKAAVSIRILKFTIANEQGQKEILDSLSHISPSLLPARLPLSSEAFQLLPAETQRLHSTLHALRAKQNAHDRALDMADLHRLMLTALSVNDDIAMIEVLQIARKNMPDAIRALERALERLIEGGHLDAEDSTAVLPSSQEEAGDGSGASLDSGNTGASPTSANTLDRKFMVAGLDALQRLSSKSTDLGLPSWTITQLEIDFWEKVGFGSFSEVFRGTWRKHTVAVKVLDKTTPRKTFLKEVELWKTLHHPNVVELFGASSASCETPWFLVCKYYPRGNLVRYLKGLSEADAVCVDAAKMIYEISKGMAHLHEQDVLHGDLKAANILVDDDSSCVVSDFGQSEMRSEVYRLTLAPQQPRGTFRWQAPELMEGAQKLTPEMDVYAFAICCWEILNMGALPWQFTEDSTVRHLVLNKNMRPELPPSNLMSGHLTNVIHVILLSWDRLPSKRPSFEQIVRLLKKQRAGAERR